ncbi:arabinosyltransferase C [Amycolatopsis arida]|uniref:Arabinosyltransferase C n=1 Tax=Amycolatopsis arida TaxID=587909 RepID=A0A1I5LME3_9PSEU|nr:arabinosyltransferase domain-containing protein [Amycolatopsis arida]TDX93770.1 arabinosyltransferase C [Amycolatopsis arida]SFO98375.1 arabinosyltransferase C [Amycolatopsis arida]
MRLATTSSADTRDEVSVPTPVTGDAGRDRTFVWRRLAVGLGFLAALCAFAFPFLPVVQDTARIVWPAGGDTSQVNAPLSGYWAQDMRVRVPCATVQSVDVRTPGSALLFATVPSARSEDGAGMQLRIGDGLLVASNRGEQVARQPLPPEGCDVTVSSTARHTTISVAGTPIFDERSDVRPRVVGIYTAIDAAHDPIDGLSVSITPDTRYQSSPTGWKTGVGILGVLAFVGCLIAVNRLDAGVARRAPRWAPVGWWHLTGRDITVFLALGAWVFIGPVTSDDGYILTMSRVTEEAGYLTNYHRWFGVAEAPFGWFYHVYELMTHVSTVPPWIRLPSFVLGLVSWLLISREVMPRLGKEVRTSRAAGWAAAAVFLVWWMPFNNGVRPEPVAAVGSLLALCAVERALVTRRLLPLCLGLLAAAFTLAATPTGLIAVAPFLVAGRPLFQLLRQRARQSWPSVLAPIAASGVLVLFVVFADQTFATVLEATRLRALVGPSMSWFEELYRYQLLFSSTADGSAARRFPVLLLLLCTGTCLVVLLRRGRIPGAALGPSRRLIGTVALFFLLLALTPTKWTHHFGAFAAVGAAMAALTALATSSSVLRSKRNRAAFLSGLLVVAALATTGPNAYWFVSNFGVPWSDRAPSIGGLGLSTLLLGGAAIAAVVAFLENVRAQRPGAPQPPERRGRSLRLGSMSLVVVCGTIAAAEFASMATAIQGQHDSYSLGEANIRHLFGSSCNLADHVMVERDPVSSMLAPLPPAQQVTVDETTSGPGGLPGPEDGNGTTSTGFHTRAALTGDPLAEPPHGFTTDTVAMWSSYDERTTPTGRLRTEWYDLADHPPHGQLVLAVAAARGKATSVHVEFGRPSPEGFRVADRRTVLPPGGGYGNWNDVRINLSEVPPGATAARVVAADDDFTEDGWVAVTAPRVPTFTTLTDKVGDKPVYMDWPTSFVYPCLTPAKTRDGISEVPAYRITADTLASEADWASSKGGGPNGWLEEVADQPEVPSFLGGEPERAWGKLLEIEPYAEGAPPTVLRGQEVHPGWWSPGPGPAQPDGSEPTR